MDLKIAHDHNPVTLFLRNIFLTFSPSLIGQGEIDEAVESLRTEWITTGPKVKRLKEEFATFIGAPAVLGLNSCTAALHVGLSAFSIGPGNAIITTPINQELATN
jgi:dTDP-4-amino-4,6-dideoxygalactose transaminase